jgi:hypothetical protein
MQPTPGTLGVFYLRKNRRGKPYCRDLIKTKQVCTREKIGKKTNKIAIKAAATNQK